VDTMDVFLWCVWLPRARRERAGNPAARRPFAQWLCRRRTFFIYDLLSDRGRFRRSTCLTLSGLARWASLGG
jgi:hypothetical protein